ncbi:fimbrillin family protein [Prevotella sp. E9-3]|uniref:fimbrillin family protein n=1 Tax=Prevotella sp. E9-3 TaxID=2913621 RepID=UPI001EDA6C19|nr:fimbrillin family protein [Prevotella sp. E9-3]UKK47960.1 fimbrillin family protein [Prevotella sp. E9-3]
MRRMRLMRQMRQMRLMGPMRLMGLIRPIGTMRAMLLMALLFALSSCSKGSDEELTEQPATEQPEEMPILFAGNMPEPTDVTRAASLSSTGQTSFTVWGYKNMSYSAGTYGETQCVFPSYVVNWTSNSAGTTTSNSSGWEYVAQTPNQTIKFWDWSAKAYRFFAVTGWTDAAAPATIEGYEADEAYGADGSYETYRAYKVSMLADACSTDAMDKTPFFSRLWFSTGDPVTYADKQFGKPVTLEFLKPYTRVRFVFKYVFPREGIELKDKSFKPTDGSSIVRKGIVTVSYPLEGPKTEKWFEMTKDTDTDPDPHLTDFSEDYDSEDDTKVYTGTAKGWYTVLPNLSQGSYTLTVTINGKEKTAVVPANYMQWLPGYSYTYVFKITDEGGVEIGWVESAVTPWTEMEADWTVYNW